MAGVDLRNLGTTATFGSKIKRGTGRLSDGRAVALVIDTNLASSGGTDTTGVAKIYLYLSTTSTRTAFTAAVALTPAVAPASSTRYAVASMAVGTDNSVWVAWQGVDNALYCTKWTYSAGVFTFVATQTVVAAGAITNRFRAIDIDIAGTNNPIIGAYEASASTGLSATMRAYVRMNDNTTWIRALSSGIINGQFISSDSEDCSISWSLDGIVTNVGKFLYYVSKSTTVGDIGDEIAEASFNTSTGTTDSANATFGAWSQSWNQNRAAGTRRGWIYKLTTGSSALWLMAGSVGSIRPEFWATKLTTLNHSPFVQTKVSAILGFLSQNSAYNYFQIDFTNPKGCISTEYADNRLIWGFASYGTTNPRVYREVMFRYNNIVDYEAAFVDNNPRPLDSNTYYGDGTIHISGGSNNRLTAGTQTYNFVASYGGAANGVSAFDFPRKMRFVAEDVYDAPTLRAPVWPATVAQNNPSFQVYINPLATYNNLYGKLDIQLATDSTFTTNVRTCTEPNSAFAYYGSQDGGLPASKLVTVSGSNLSAPLFTGAWYWRARLLSDKGNVGAWSGTEQFDVLHTPSATLLNPPIDTVQTYGTGDVAFSWRFSDPEVTDTQSAYRLVITRTDTGVVSLDTGYVTSSAKTHTATLSSGLKEVPLQWQVSVKDSDGTASPLTAARRLTVGDAPVATLTAPPQVGTDTLNLNPTFEVDASSWTATNGTFARDITQFQTGIASGKLTPNGTSPAPQVESDKVSGITQYQRVFATSWVRTPTTWAGGVSLVINWYTSGNVFISSSTIATVASLTGATWTQISGWSGPAPATAAKAALVAVISGTPAAANTLFIDESRIKKTTATTALPTVTWTFTGSGGRLQRAYRIVVVDLSTGLTVGDTLWVFSAANSYSFPLQILQNNTAYSFTLYLQDGAGLQGTSTSYVYTTWVAPSQPSPVTVTQDGFKATINWDETDVDPGFLSWRVWRRYQKPALLEMDFDSTATVWELIAETDNPLTDTYLDYLAPLNRTVEYAVTQLADRFGSLIDSLIGTTQSITVSADRYYFVPVTPVGTIASFEASGVSADAFTFEVEEETLHVIGRGRQVQVGDELGETGTLTLHLRKSSSRADREFITYLAGPDSDGVWIRSPFGDVLLVRLGNVSFTRMAGVGTGDLGDLSVPYMKVISDYVPVTRVI